MRKKDRKRERIYLQAQKKPSFKARYCETFERVTIYLPSDVLSLEISAQEISISDQSREIQFVHV